MLNSSAAWIIHINASQASFFCIPIHRLHTDVVHLGQFYSTPCRVGFLRTLSKSHIGTEQYKKYRTVPGLYIYNLSSPPFDFASLFRPPREQLWYPCVCPHPLLITTVATASKPSGMKSSTGGYLAMWLCAEHRLGRVGTLKWGSFVAALGFVIMGTTIQTTSLFVVTSLFTLLFQGEREQALPYRTLDVMFLARSCSYCRFYGVCVVFFWHIRPPISLFFACNFVVRHFAFFLQARLVMVITMKCLNLLCRKTGECFTM